MRRGRGEAANKYPILIHTLSTPVSLSLSLLAGHGRDGGGACPGRDHSSLLRPPPDPVQISLRHCHLPPSSACFSRHAPRRQLPRRRALDATRRPPAASTASSCPASPSPRVPLLSPSPPTRFRAHLPTPLSDIHGISCHSPAPTSHLASSSSRAHFYLLFPIHRPPDAATDSYPTFPRPISPAASLFPDSAIA
ncbi:hypothetical protein BD413DRAFT_47469 [Trametes elegans]|nr:hypothetical protein BD413DRAFT_47469 [Trametes elegans]